MSDEELDRLLTAADEDHAAMVGRDFCQRLVADLREARVALRKIEAWQMPPSGRFWESDPSRQMTYAGAFGSNGERDVIRQIARTALGLK